MTHSTPAGLATGVGDDDLAGTSSPTLQPAADQTTDRPMCRVVGHYCEALWWLRRERACPASVCCRHYWADAEQVAS